MVGHLEALNTSIKAVQHCSQIELSIRTSDLGDVCKEFFIWVFCGKVLFDKIFRLLSFAILLGNTIRALLRADH